MKRRLRVSIVLAVVLFTSVIVFVLNKDSDPRHDQPALKTNESIRTQQGVDMKAEETNKSQELPLPPPQKSMLDRQDRLRVSVEAKNVPISFWGRVIDQDNKPLEGCRVKLSVRQWYVQSMELLNPGGRFPKYELLTDASGLFQLVDAKGDVLTVESVEKEGYETSRKALRSYGYDASTNFVPDPVNPVVIRMWKTGVQEPLVKFDKDTRIPYDGTPVVFDLLKGQKLPPNIAGGDIRITLLRVPLDVRRGGKERYDWKATIEAIDGGLIETADEFMYQAPEVGYLPRIVIEMPASSPNWATRKRVSHYLRSRNGQCYSRVTIEFRTDSERETTGITVTSALNPAGSRNLQ